MMLGMTENGKIYQTASHRPDGKGFEQAPIDVDVQDVTLDNAVSNANTRLELSNKDLAQHNLRENIQAEKDAMSWARLRRKAHAVQAIKDELSINPEYQKQLQYDGLLQNINQSSDFNQLEVSGFGLSADGVRGPSRRQRAYERAILEQMGAIPSADVTPVEDAEIYSVDAAEKEQLQLQILADAYKKDLSENLYSTQPVKYVVNPAVVKAALPSLYANLDSEAEITDTTALEDDVTAMPKFLKHPVVLIIGGILLGKMLLK